MDPDVVTRLNAYANEVSTLTPAQHEEINGILIDLIERCKGSGHGQDEKSVDSRSQLFRESIPYSVFQNLHTLAEYWLLTLDHSSHELLCNLCRFGRNTTVTSKRNQDLMVESGLISVSVTILQEEAPKMCERQAGADLVLTRLALQLACNCMVCNVEVAERLVVQQKFFDTILEIITSFDDEQTRQYAAMTGYTIVDLLGYGSEVNVTVTGRQHALEIIMEKLDEEPFKLWFSALVGSERFIPAMYEGSERETGCRVRILKNIAHHEVPLPDESVVCLRNVFKELVLAVVNARPDEVERHITEELAGLLALLTQLSTDLESSRTNMLLQDDQQLVNLANRLLKTVHLAGKQAQNSLTPLEKIEDVQRSMTDADLVSQPTYLFKSNLIRLIGNLAHKHKPNQTVAMDQGSLPIILECTKIDGRNPFAPQCAVFALKFLLEGNAANQNFVAQMNKI